MSQVTEQSVRFQTALASIKLIQAPAVLDLTEDDFDFLTSNKVWIATDRSRARRCVEACVYGTLDFVGYPRFPAPVEFIAAVIAYYVHPVNIQTACLIMEGAEFTENIINGVERPVKAAELFAFTLRVRAGNTDPPQRQKLKFLPLRRYNLTLNLLSRSHDWIASGRQIAINGHIKFNLTIPLQQLNGLETLVIIMVANKYAFLQITRRRFLNEWEAFKKVISRRNIRRRITIPLTLSNLKLLRRITRTENILHRNFTRRQVAIQNRVASNIGISQSTFSVKVLNLFSRSRRKTNKRKSKHSAMLRNKETRHRMFIGLLNTTRKLA